MIYIDIDAGGFYNSDIHSIIPETAKEITQEAYDFFLENNGQYKIDKEKASEIDIITVAAFTKIEYEAVMQKDIVSDVEIAFAEYVIETEMRLAQIEEKMEEI